MKMKAVCTADYFCRTLRELRPRSSKWRLPRAKPALNREHPLSFHAFVCRGLVRKGRSPPEGHGNSYIKRQSGDPLTHTLDIEVPHVERIIFNELAPRLDRIAHQDREDLVRFNGIINP